MEQDDIQPFISKMLAWHPVASRLHVLCPLSECSSEWRRPGGQQKSPMVSGHGEASPLISNLALFTARRAQGTGTFNFIRF